MPYDFKVLQVMMDHKQIGTITHLPGDKNLFVFDESYSNYSSRPTLSLSFKDIDGELITAIKATRTRLPPFNAQHEFVFLWMLGQGLPGAVKIQAMENDLIPEESNELLAQRKNKKVNPLRFSLAGVQLKFSAIKKLDSLTILTTSILIDIGGR